LPIIRKVIKAGESRVLTLPASWLAFHEEESGQRITRCSVEVDGALTIRPILAKKEPPK
jgi:antitoxin component of MazEF toxin-antitoxin module